MSEQNDRYQDKIWVTTRPTRPTEGRPNYSYDSDSPHIAREGSNRATSEIRDLMEELNKAIADCTTELTDLITCVHSVLSPEANQNSTSTLPEITSTTPLGVELKSYIDSLRKLRLIIALTSERVRL